MLSVPDTQRMADASLGSRLFEPEPGQTYLDAAGHGLLPTPSVDAMARAIADLQAGIARPTDDWDRPTETARAHFADLIGASTADIAMVSSVSSATGLIASSLKSGDVVVVSQDEHVSDLFPLLVAEQRGVVVRQVPPSRLVDAIEAGVSLVVLSLVPMQTGRVADLATICERARQAGVRILVDSSHATPFVSIRDHIADIDFLVCTGYKHLLGMRGSSFLYVRADRVTEIAPSYASWRSGERPFELFFGGPLSLAGDAARFNVSLAWLPWVGTTHSLPLIVRWRDDGTLEGARSLADRLARDIGLEPTGSSLVCAQVGDMTATRAALQAARIRASTHAGVVRFSVHVWNTPDDVDLAAATIRPYLLST